MDLTLSKEIHYERVLEFISNNPNITFSFIRCECNSKLVDLVNSLISSLKSIKFIDEELNSSYSKLKVDYNGSLHNSNTKLEFSSKLYLNNFNLEMNKNLKYKSAFEYQVNEYSFGKHDAKIMELINIPVYSLSISSDMLNRYSFKNLSLQQCFTDSIRRFELKMPVEHFHYLKYYISTLNNLFPNLSERVLDISYRKTFDPILVLDQLCWLLEQREFKSINFSTWIEYSEHKNNNVTLLSTFVIYVKFSSYFLIKMDFLTYR